MSTPVTSVMWSTPNPEVVRAQKLEALQELEAWVADLTSGTRTQGRNALRKVDDTYCCVGVLCERFVETKPDLLRVVSPWEDDDVFGYIKAIDESPATSTVPKSVHEFFRSRGVVISWGALYRMNDGSAYVDERGDERLEESMSFAQIADYLRKQYIDPLKQELGL